jgi:hypothetical protein
MKNFHWIATALAVGILSVSSIGAQEPRIVTSTNFVSVNVVATNKSGRFVRELTRDDFELFDEKVKQQIPHFSSDPAAVALRIVYETHPGTST